MPNSFVLMTAMPPTKGHLSLIKYAKQLGNLAVVIVCTQPGEPMPEERVQALRDATDSIEGVAVLNFHRTVPQEPSDEDPTEFWNMWASILKSYGFCEGDYIVASEPYGLDLEQATGGVFMPFDRDRWITPSKATLIRESFELERYQEEILPEFLTYIRRTVTIFGAESVGKTTVTKALGHYLKATITPEWARPYLEMVGPKVTEERMDRIHEGQRAVQAMVREDSGLVYIVQDTDLFSTVGYWEMWDKDSMPLDLLDDARECRSDLYVILSSDIPFEPDPLRYGGTVRESTDQYWIDLCEREDLPYVYITHKGDRAGEAFNAIVDFFGKNPLSYQRVGKEYERNV